ncbi:hypothetical protein [Paucisalibacillus globulus]|uniref:hypothetical protein n=1 Tax=Paucisalibacillus globulus TaxID=351095 RepID=UPI000BB774BF|nr:hypothetical protein [Paucisalibacillus globulus]
MALEWKKKEWGVYKGDEFLFIGSTKECANRLGVSENTIYFYTTNAYKRRIEKRNAKNPIILVDLGIEGD